MNIVKLTEGIGVTANGLRHEPVDIFFRLTFTIALQLAFQCD
jgi:hypothetical protein